ncbi:MAG: hypothetical protein KGL48_16895 [Sphingomonadales bacterium]|nr:hypothetical protein [Sphingomonadales bacterium]MDE2569640.1 hypothetical protein [Sphingomonadales bacterium]
MANSKALKAMAAGAAAFASLALGGAAMAQAIVIRSTGPSAGQYPQGKKLPAAASVTLRAGDRVTVLDKSGTRVLSGPGTFSVTGAVDHTNSGGAVETMLAMGGARMRTRTGAVRGDLPDAAPPTGPDSVWYIDVSKGGTYCVADPAKLVLWRPNHVEAASGKLAGASGTVASVEWKRGNALKLWPSAALPVVDGKSYTFSDPVGPSVTITTRLMGEVPADSMDIAAKMAAMGCTRQLDVLANTAAAGTPGG